MEDQVNGDCQWYVYIKNKLDIFVDAFVKVRYSERKERDEVIIENNIYKILFQISLIFAFFIPIIIIIDIIDIFDLLPAYLFIIIVIFGSIIGFLISEKKIIIRNDRFIVHTILGWKRTFPVSSHPFFIIRKNRLIIPLSVKLGPRTTYNGFNCNPSNYPLDEILNDIEKIPDMKIYTTQVQGVYIVSPYEWDRFESKIKNSLIKYSKVGKE